MPEIGDGPGLAIAAAAARVEEIVALLRAVGYATMTTTSRELRGGTEAV